MTLTCCVLHNICEEFGDSLIDGDYIGGQRGRQYVQPSTRVLHDHGEPEAEEIRTALMNFCSGREE